MPFFVFHSVLKVIQVTLVSKGYTQNFTFTKEDGEDEVARITLPSYLFQNQGESMTACS